MPETYQEIPELITEKRGDAQNQHLGYQNVSESDLKSYVNQAVSMETEHLRRQPNSYISLLRESEAYEEVPDCDAEEDQRYQTVQEAIN